MKDRDKIIEPYGGACQHQEQAIKLLQVQLIRVSHLSFCRQNLSSQILFKVFFKFSLLPSSTTHQKRVVVICGQSLIIGMLFGCTSFLYAQISKLKKASVQQGETYIYTCKVLMKVDLGYEKPSGSLLFLDVSGYVNIHQGFEIWSGERRTEQPLRMRRI